MSTFMTESTPDYQLAPVLLTVADISRLKAEYEADVRLLEELPARIKLKKRKYEAALLFAPAGFDPDAPVVQSPAPVTPDHVEPDFQLTASDDDEEEESAGKLTWIGEVGRLLSEADRGLSHKELLDTISAGPLGERRSHGDKGFYNAVARLERRGELVKSGGLLYSSGLVAEMLERGEHLPEMTSEMRRRAGGSGAVVLEVLAENPKGMDANRLRDEVGKKPGVPSSITKHVHYIYNVLATLIRNGEVEKTQDGVYRAVKTN